MTEPGKADSSDSERPGEGASLFAELQKRRVYQSAVAYAVVAWGVTEILEGVISGLGWPDWLATLAVILFVTGFPVAMFLAWVYDWTPDGVRRTASSGPLGWLPAGLAIAFLVAGSAGLFWLINPSGVARVERIGVAVLPCRYRGDEANSFRGEGLAEVINDRLACLSYLFVPDFPSTLIAYAKHPATAQLAQSLHVSTLVDCRITEAPDGYRVTASMIDTATDESREIFDADVRSLEIAGVLDALERDIVRELGLPPAEGGLQGDFTESVSAFDAYLRGRRALRQGTPADLDDARDHFKGAQDAGRFTLARVGEAEVMLALFETRPPPAASRAAGLKAIALLLDEIERDESVPAELYAARLRLANLEDRFAGTSEAGDMQRRAWFDRATALRPSFAEPYLLYAEYLQRTGRGDEARMLLDLAREIAPFL